MSPDDLITAVQGREAPLLAGLRSNGGGRHHQLVPRSSDPPTATRFIHTSASTRKTADRSGADPWGGGPFGFQVDILDSVPDERAYTPLRQPNLVSWKDGANPHVLTSVSELMAARDDGELDITPTEVVDTAPVVSWPGDPFVEYPKANGISG